MKISLFTFLQKQLRWEVTTARPVTLQSNWSWLCCGVIVQTAHWKEELTSQAIGNTTLVNLSLELSIDTLHPLWQNVNSAFFDIKKAIIKAKLVTKTYTLHVNKAQFNKYRVDPTFPVCKTDVETLEHFILHCPSLQRERLEKTGEFITEISDRNTWTYIAADDFRAVRFILDASNFIDVLPALKRTQILHHMEHLTRNLCYDLHRRRAVIL